MWDKVPGLNNADAQEKILHAWKAGPQTVALRRQLEAMPRRRRLRAVDPGRAVPLPARPVRARVPGRVVLQAREAEVEGADPRRQRRRDVEGPAVQEGVGRGVQGHRRVPRRTTCWPTSTSRRARRSSTSRTRSRPTCSTSCRRSARARSRAPAGVVTANDRWCDVDFLTFESIKVKNVHVLGDAIQVAPGMPKSGHMANQQAKVCAAAVVALLAGQAPNPTPVLTNTCYSMITDTRQSCTSARCTSTTPRRRRCCRCRARAACRRR